MDYVNKFDEARKDPMTFEALLNEEPGEVIKHINLEEDLREAREDAEHLEKC